MMRAAAVLSNLTGAALLLASFHAPAQTGAWDFRVYLNDSPIGYHRFTLREQGAEREMKIEANFNVKVLFINAYSYVHEATERWRGNCLESLAARTDDNGERLAVDSARDGDRLAVMTGKGRELLGSCVMSFAYWNPEILRQSRLLNAQTGEYETVKIAALGEESIPVRGAQVMAKHYRITGPKNPIDLWYSADQVWLALESTLESGRRLRYRIER